MSRDIDLYTALAFVLHTDRKTAKRWFWCLAYGATRETQRRILADEEPYYANTK